MPIIFFLPVLLFWLPPSLVAQTPARNGGLPTTEVRDTTSYEIVVESEHFALRDLTRLAATVFRPTPRVPAERFPVLLELLPYRKDDLYLARDHPVHSWFARRGFITVRVDVRGTGGSDGTIPDREYSEQELRDAADLIELLSRLPGSNGRVGMWGISWSGFNALQLALEPPPALKAVLVAHASEDLYRDDSHYIDGLPSVSWYELTIDHWNGLPRSPDYAVDDTFFAQRFDREPWIFQKFRHPVDGAWWRADRRGPIKIPAYMIGGLYDGYRDAIFRIAETAEAPVMAELGPWGHAFPNAAGRLSHEWGHRAVRWWNHWLRDQDTGILDEPRLALYVRGSSPSRSGAGANEGEWRWADLPYRPRGPLVLHAAAAGALTSEAAPPGPSVADTLIQDPSSGTSSGLLWWEAPGDMRRDDSGALLYDGPRLDSTIVVAGIPTVRLVMGPDDCRAHWIVRLEDVRPDGTVAFVTGGAAGGGCTPSPGERPTMADVPLRFTTWRFHPGHRIRLAITNAQFPMVWPSPLARTSVLAGAGGTRLELPLAILREESGPSWPAPQPRERTPGTEYVESSAPAYSRVVRDRYARTVTVEEAWGGGRRSGDREWTDEIQYAHRVSEDDPNVASFEGDARFTVTLEGRVVEILSSLDVQSDSSWFDVVFERRLMLDGASSRSQTWRERFARGR